MSLARSLARTSISHTYGKYLQIKSSVQWMARWRKNQKCFVKEKHFFFICFSLSLFHTTKCYRFEIGETLIFLSSFYVFLFFVHTWLLLLLLCMWVGEWAGVRCLRIRIVHVVNILCAINPLFYTYRSLEIGNWIRYR